jgi:hypothetical protein
MTYTLLIMGFAVTGFLSMQECQDAGKKAIEAAAIDAQHRCVRTDMRSGAGGRGGDRRRPESQQVKPGARLAPRAGKPIRFRIDATCAARTWSSSRAGRQTHVRGLSVANRDLMQDGIGGT